MMLALYLLILAMTITAASSRALATARWVYQAPRLALAAWQIALAAVVLSAIAAFGALWWPGASEFVSQEWFVIPNQLGLS